MKQPFGYPTEQAADLHCSSVQSEGLSDQFDWPRHVAAKCEITRQVEASTRLLTRGELGEAASRFYALLQVGLNANDSELKEVASHNLAAVYRQSRNWGMAAVWQQQSMSWRMRRTDQTSQQSHDELGRLACDLTGRGGDAFLCGDLLLAESLWRRALAIEEWRGSLEGQAIDSGNLGLLAARKGRLDEGLQWLKQSLRLNRLMLNECSEGTDLLNLAELRRLKGEIPRAIRSLQKSVQCFERGEAPQLRELAANRLREVQRIESLQKLDPQVN